MKSDANPQGSKSPPPRDSLLDQILFLARFFGKPVEPQVIIGGVPLTDGLLTENELEECTTRAGLAATVTFESPERLTPTMFPALVLATGGKAIALLNRRDDLVECKLPFIAGTRWIKLADLLKGESVQRWYLIRPLLYFDDRSLIYQKAAPLRWFWDTLLENRWIYGWALAGTVVVNLFAAVIPFFTMAVYDRVVPNGAIGSLKVLATAAIAVVLMDLLMKILRSYLVDSAARRADIVLSARIFSQTLKLRAATRPASGGVLANIVRDFESIREFFASTTLTLLGDMPFMLLFLGVIALIGGPLVWVPLIMIPLALGVSFLLRRPLTRVLDENMQEQSQRTAHLFEVMNGLDSIKSLGAEAWARRKWEMLTVKLSGNAIKMREITAFGNYFTAMTIALTTVLLVTFGAMMIAAGDLSMGQLIAVSMLSARAVTPVAQLAGLIVRWQQTKLSLTALNRIMAAPTDEDTGTLHLSAIQGRVEFRDVKFAYPDSPATLKGMGLSLNAGEKVAFIGRIGSGKSSLLKLLLNLYVPQEGVVLVDGVAVNQIDPYSLRRNIGYVPQDVVLFHGSIRENIVIGASDVTDTDILDAVRIAGLEETLARLPQGLDSQVGERGERLSGGQRQAVAIARALVRKPRLLLMDEPSSMMDPATEHRFIMNVRATLQHTTLLLVTHRTAMLPLVDRLVVLENGQVMLDGPRDEVMRRLGQPIERPVVRPVIVDNPAAESARAGSGQGNSGASVSALNRGGAQPPESIQRSA
ncbi:MAG: type I secretion system permease/ATPase [Thiotrichales bacterium]